MPPFFATQKGRTILAITATVAVLLAFAAFVRTVTRSGPPLLPSGRSGDNAYLSVQDAIVAGRVHGQPRWRVRAQSLVFSQDRTTVTAMGVHDGVLLGSDNRPALSLTAGRAVFYAPPGDVPGTPESLRQGILTLTGNITAGVLQRGGPTVTAQQLTWNGAQGIATASGQTSALFPLGPAPLGSLRLETDNLVWTARDGVLRIPGTARASFRNGGSASGENVEADTRTGNLSMHNVHASFPVSPGTLMP